MKSALIISLLILGVYSNCNCDSGEYMDDTTWTCKTPTQETENCLYYQYSDGVKCQICKEGYYRNSTNACIELTTELSNCRYTKKETSLECMLCKENYYTNNGQCVQNGNIEGCKEYEHEDSVQKCDKCQEGYYKKDNLCVQNPTTVENCKKYKWNSGAAECTVCETSYHLDNKACVQNADGFAYIDGCEGYFKDGTVVKCQDCVDYQYEKKNDTCKECPFVRSDSGALLRLGIVLLIVLIAFLA